MSTVKISELPVLSSADAADEFVVVDDSAGVTKKITFDSLATEVRTESEPLSATTVTASGDVTIADKIVHSGDTDTALRFPSDDTVSIETGDSERLRVDSLGRLQVNTSGNNGMVSVAGIASLRPAIQTHTSATSSQNGIEFYNPNGLVGRITTNGSSTSYVTSSDYRLKNNVQPLHGALSRVADLRPVTFTWRVDGSEGEGFIAHELQDVCPDAVVGEKDAMSDAGEPLYQGVDLSAVVPVLVGAVKELLSKVDALESRLGESDV